MSNKAEQKTNKIFNKLKTIELGTPESDFAPRRKTRLKSKIKQEKAINDTLQDVPELNDDSTMGTTETIEDLNTQKEEEIVCTICNLTTTASQVKEHEFICIANAIRKKDFRVLGRFEVNKTVKSRYFKSEDEESVDEELKCPICKKNLKKLAVTSRETHVDRCLNKKGSKAKEVEFRCPICLKLKKFKSRETFSRHFTTCAKNNKITTEVAMSIVKTGENENMDKALELAMNQRSDEDSKSLTKPTKTKAKTKAKNKFQGNKKPKLSADEESMKIAVANSLNKPIDIIGRKTKKYGKLFPAMLEESPTKKKLAMTDRLNEIKSNNVANDSDDLPSTPQLPDAQICNQDDNVLEKTHESMASLFEKKSKWIMSSTDCSREYKVPGLLSQFETQQNFDEDVDIDAVRMNESKIWETSGMETDDLIKSSNKTKKQTRRRSKNKPTEEVTTESDATDYYENQTNINLRNFSSQETNDGSASVSNLNRNKKAEQRNEDNKTVWLNKLSEDMHKMIDNKQFTDGIIQFNDGKKLNIHKFILHARCPELLKEIEITPQNGFHLKMDCPKVEFMPFIEYIYTGCISNSRNDKLSYSEAYGFAQIMADRYKVTIPVSYFEPMERPALNHIEAESDIDLFDSPIPSPTHFSHIEDNDGSFINTPNTNTEDTSKASVAMNGLQSTPVSTTSRQNKRKSVLSSVKKPKKKQARASITITSDGEVNLNELDKSLMSRLPRLGDSTQLKYKVKRESITKPSRKKKSASNDSLHNDSVHDDSTNNEFIDRLPVPQQQPAEVITPRKISRASLSDSELPSYSELCEKPKPRKSNSGRIIHLPSRYSNVSFSQPTPMPTNKYKFKQTNNKYSSPVTPAPSANINKEIIDFKTPATKRIDNGDEMTPVPHYSAMDTPEVQRLGTKMGLKKTLSKNQYCKKLKEKHLFEHQIETPKKLANEPVIEDEDSLAISYWKGKDLSSFNDVPNKSESEASMVNLLSEPVDEVVLVDNEDSSSDEEKMESEVLQKTLFGPLFDDYPSSSTQSSDDDEILPMTLMDRIKARNKVDLEVEISSSLPAKLPEILPPKVTKTKTKKLTGDELYREISRVIQTEIKLMNDILQYKPIYLSDIRSLLTLNGIKHSMNTILDYLDSKCITFSTANENKKDVIRRKR